MAKKRTFALAILILCFTQFSFAGNWHIINQGLEYRKPVFADSALGWMITARVDTISWDIDDCIYRTNDGGNTWVQLTGVSNRLFNTCFYDLCFKQGKLFSSQCDYDIGGGGYPLSIIITSDNLGSAWYWINYSYFQPDRVARLSVLDTSNMWVVADSCYKFETGEWVPRSLLPVPYPGYNKKIVFVDTMLGYVANLQNGIVNRTIDGGFLWDSLVQFGQSNDFLCTDRKDLWLLNGTRIKHSSDSGNTWQTNDPDTTLAKQCFSSFDSLNLWVGCEHGVVLHTPDGGQSWEWDSVGTSANVVSIFALSNNYVWVSTADSKLWGLGVTGVSEQHDPDIQASTTRMKAYPNPSNGLITVQYNVTNQGQGSVKIYDIMGRLVKTLASGLQTTGGHNINWDWRNEGRAVSSGVYFIKCIMTGSTKVEKIVLVR